MTLEDCDKHATLTVEQATGLKLTPRESNILGCLLKGVACAAPEAIKCFIACISAAATRHAATVAGDDGCPCKSSYPEHEVSKGVLHVQDAVQLASGTQLTPIQVDIIGCVISALVCAVPSFLNCFITCISTPTEPPTGDYKPGDRNRCG